MKLFEQAKDRATLLNLAFQIEGKTQMVPMSQFPYALENGLIKPETLYFNNTVLTKDDLAEKWLIPVKDSWLGARYSLHLQS